MSLRELFDRQPRKAFRDYQKQLAYEDAWGRAEELQDSFKGEGRAYQTGYFTDDDWPKTSVLYPYFLAGRDRQKQGY